VSQFPDAKEHLFLVLASPVAEVGRDHDYDWAVIEPSSMRSIIQIAGRVWRHRKKVCESPNVFVLDQNLRALKRESIAFHRPGFENARFKLSSHKLSELGLAEHLPAITAASRIASSAALDPSSRLVDLEHERLTRLLLENNRDNERTVREFWAWSYWGTALSQQKWRFRNSLPTESYWLEPTSDDSYVLMRECDDGSSGEMEFTLKAFEPQRVSIWPLTNFRTELQALADSKDMSLSGCAKRYATLELEERTNSDGWVDHGVLGFARST
jgi:CRISPR-associated endonuclease/helicase Cas3